LVDLDVAGTGRGGDLISLPSGIDYPDRCQDAPRLGGSGLDLSLPLKCGLLDWLAVGGGEEQPP